MPTNVKKKKKRWKWIVRVESGKKEKKKKTRRKEIGFQTNSANTANMLTHGVAEPIAPRHVLYRCHLLARAAYQSMTRNLTQGLVIIVICCVTHLLGSSTEQGMPYIMCSQWCVIASVDRPRWFVSSLPFFSGINFQISMLQTGK